MIPVDLVEQGAEAHAQQFRRRPSVAARGLEGRDDGLTLRGLDSFPEGPAPRSLRPRAVSGERVLSEIRRLEDLSIRQHRRTLDGVLQLGHVARPALRFQPGPGVVDEDTVATAAAGDAGADVARD